MEKSTITNVELANRMQMHSETVTLEDLSIIGEEVNLYGQYTANVVLNNCSFKQLNLKRCQFVRSLTFEKCTFEKGICFEDVECMGVLILNSCKVNELILNNSIFSEILIEETIFKHVSFSGFLKGKSIKNAPIIFSDTTIENFHIEDAEIYKPLKFKSLLVENEFHVFRSAFKSSVSFGDYSNGAFKAESLLIESSSFWQRIDFLAGEINYQIYLHKVELKEQVVYRAEFYAKNIRFVEVQASHTTSLDFANNFEQLDFNNCTFNPSLTVSPPYNQKIDPAKGFTIQFDGVINGNYIINNVPASYISISCVNFGNILFLNTSTISVWLDNFFNYSRLFFKNINLNKQLNNAFIIFDSNLGNTEFENLDFRKFKEVVIAKSDVSSMMLTNCLPPRRIQIKTKDSRIGVVIGELEKINDTVYFKDSYRQLRLAMEKVGNRYYALLYKSREMHYQRKELPWGWDKLLLYVNYISNNYGLSWFRGIVFTLACAFISFALLNEQLIHPLFYWDFNSSKEEIAYSFQNGFQNYIHYIASYPLLKIDGLDDSNWKVNLLVLLSRIFISIGIYQTITAFRKYGK